MSDAPDMHARMKAYYTRYYRDTLRIPGWGELVAVRVDDEGYEQRRFERLESALGDRVQGRLLNVGCGTGGFNVVAERAGCETWGVDLSGEAAGIAARRIPGRRIVCAPAEALPFRDGCFDLVYCFSTLEHVADARQAVREMVRVLRVRGTLYIHTPNRWGCFESHYKVVWIPGLPRWAARAYLAARGRPTEFLATLRLLTLAECRQLLEEAGATVVRILNRDARRAVGGALWPLVRLYYSIFGIHPYVEIVAVRGETA